MTFSSSLQRDMPGSREERSVLGETRTRSAGLGVNRWWRWDGGAVSIDGSGSSRSSYVSCGYLSRRRIAGTYLLARVTRVGRSKARERAGAHADCLTAV